MKPNREGFHRSDNENWFGIRHSNWNTSKTFKETIDSPSADPSSKPSCGGWRWTQRRPCAIYYTRRGRYVTRSDRFERLSCRGDLRDAPPNTYRQGRGGVGFNSCVCPQNLFSYNPMFSLFVFVKGIIPVATVGVSGHLLVRPHCSEGSNRRSPSIERIALSLFVHFMILLLVSQADILCPYDASPLSSSTVFPHR